MLDVGCGTGSFSRIIAEGMERRGTLVGIDSDKNLLQVAKKRAREEKLAGIMEFVLGDAYNLPFARGTFNIVTSHTLLGVLQNPQRCIFEKKRVAETDGKISVVENISGLKDHPGKYPDSINIPRLLELNRKLNKVFTEEIYPKLGIGSETSPLQYPQLFLQAGLRNIEINGYLSLFSFSDSRYTAREMLDYLQRDYKDRLRKLLENRNSYIRCGLTKNEFEEILDLLKKRHEFLTQNPEHIHQVMEIVSRPRIIVSGLK